MSDFFDHRLQKDYGGVKESGFKEVHLVEVSEEAVHMKEWNAPGRETHWCLG